MIKFISSPNWEKIDDDEIVIFLTGPIQGSFNWHEEALKLFYEKCDANITIASPKRKIGMEKSEEGYKEQVRWETKHLHRASKNGVILFWFANEKEQIIDNDGKIRSYGKTSRTEYGVWKTMHDIYGCNVVLGLDTNWISEKYFRTCIEQDGSNIPICYTLSETIEKTINLIK
jgi:hypothetical protein